MLGAGFTNPRGRGKTLINNNYEREVESFVLYRAITLIGMESLMVDFGKLALIMKSINSR